MDFLAGLFLLLIAGAVIAFITAIIKIVNHLSHINKGIRDLSHSIDRLFIQEYRQSQTAKTKEEPSTVDASLITTPPSPELITEEKEQETPSVTLESPFSKTSPAILETAESTRTDDSTTLPFNALNTELPTPTVNHGELITIDSETEIMKAEVIRKPVHSKPRTANPFRPAAPREPGKTELYIRNIWGRTWRWIVYGKETFAEGESKEALAASTWLMRAGILLLLFFLGFLVKVTKLDTYFTSGYGRTISAIVVGTALIFFGMRKIKTEYQIISQGLTGGGIAAFYFAVYSALSKNLLTNWFSHDTAALICLVAMIGISVFSGILALRRESMFMAIAAVSGGIAAPFFNVPTPGIINGIFIYFIILTFGLCIIAYRHRWPLLNLLSMIGIWTVFYTMLYPSSGDKPAVWIALGATLIFGTLISILPSVSAWKRRDLSSSFDVLIFLINTALTVWEGITLIRMSGIENRIEWSAAVPAVMTLILLTQFLLFLRLKITDRTLMVTWMATSTFLLTLIPGILFSSEWRVTSWSVLAAVLYWLSFKTNSLTLRTLSGITYFFCTLNLVFVNFPAMTHDLAAATSLDYTRYLLTHLITIGFPLLSMGAISYFTARPPKPINADFSDFEVWKKPDTQLMRAINIAVRILTLLLLFILLNIEFWHTFRIFFPCGQFMSLTWVWVGFACLLIFWQRIPLLYIFLPLTLAVLFKFTFFDFTDWGFSLMTSTHPFVYKSFFDSEMNYHWNTVITRILDFGILIAFFIYSFRYMRNQTTHEARVIRIAASIITTLLLFIWSSCEVSTLLYIFTPEVRSLGISLLWSLFAIIFVIRGLRGERQILRYTGLITFGVVTFKILAIDIWHEAGILRVVAMALLVILFISAAILYINYGIRKRSRTSIKE